MSIQTKRLSRLEAQSKWGGPDELESCSIVVMRVPEGEEGDQRCEAARKLYQCKHRSFVPISFASASDLPLWRPVSIDRVSDALLDELIANLSRKLAAATGLPLKQIEEMDVTETWAWHAESLARNNANALTQ